LTDQTTRFSAAQIDVGKISIYGYMQGGPQDCYGGPFMSRLMRLSFGCASSANTASHVKQSLGQKNGTRIKTEAEVTPPRLDRMLDPRVPW